MAPCVPHSPGKSLHGTASHAPHGVYGLARAFGNGLQRFHVELVALDNQPIVVWKFVMPVPRLGRQGLISFLPQPCVCVAVADVGLVSCRHSHRATSLAASWRRFAGDMFV